jgi:hypothetical protein
VDLQAPWSDGWRVTSVTAVDKLFCNGRCIWTSQEFRGAASFFLMGKGSAITFSTGHVTDAPTPIPTEGVWTGDLADLPNWDAMPRRNRRRRRRGHTPIWLRYGLTLIVLAVLVTVLQVGVHAVRSDPRDATVYAQRELALSVLKPNERIIKTVTVWQRPAIDYFRATRGILAVTDAPGDSAKPIGGRIVYLGLQPRDPLSPPDAPPTFDEREWPVDTLVSIAPKRAFFWLSSGLSVSAPRESPVTLGVPGDQADAARAVQAVVAAKYAQLRRVGWDRREQRRAKDRAARVQTYEGRRSWFHTVRRGQALASIAKMYNITPEALRSLNGIVGDRIRIGQTIMVKDWTKAPVPFPAGVTPEYPPAATPAVSAAAVAPAPAPVGAVRAARRR